MVAIEAEMRANFNTIHKISSQVRNAEERSRGVIYSNQ